MNKYEKGQIYKVVSPDFSKCYIGSTTEGIKKRLIRHKASYNYRLKNGKKKGCSCFGIFDEYGVDNCKIYWIEDYPCNSKKELEAREGYYIRNSECVNKVIVGRERNERDKEYRAKNKVRLDEYYNEWKTKNQEHLKQYKATHYQENKDHYQQKGKEWRENNKEKKKEHDTKYREEHKEELKQYFRNCNQINKEKRQEYKQQKYTCGCGAILCRGSKSKHQITKQHQNWLKQQEPEEEAEPLEQLD